MKNLKGRFGNLDAWALAAAILIVTAATGNADAGWDGQRFATGSAYWRDQLFPGSRAEAWMQIGGQGLQDQPREFGGAVDRRQGQTGPSNVGEKFKAGLLSVVLPGAGQFYNGQRQKAYIMGGVEVAIWTAYFVFDTQGDNRLEDSRDFASIYAGTGGSHDDNYWQDVARYMDSDAYYEDQLREARALQEPTPPPLDPADYWQWVNEDRMFGYRQMRADAASAYDRRDFMILFAVLNRAVAVFDAVRNAGGKDDQPGTEVLGMNVRVEVDPLGPQPEARWIVSRGF